MPNYQKGFAAPLVLVISLVGIVLGSYLVQQNTNLFPKASQPSKSAECLGVPDYPEIRPVNVKYNLRPGGPANLKRIKKNDEFYPYLEKVTGGCTGSTEQILEWAAIKWGFDKIWVQDPDGNWLNLKDLAKAIAVNESIWHQESVSDKGQSYSLLKIKTTVWPGAAKVKTSTSFAADYSMAIMRMYWDGVSWADTKGSIVAGLNAYVSGQASHDPDFDKAISRFGDCYQRGGYARKVLCHIKGKTWTDPYFISKQKKDKNPQHKN